MGIVSGIAGAISGITGLITTVTKYFFKSPEERLGRAEAKLEQRDATDEAQKRVDDVGPASVDDTVDKLHDGKF